MSIQGSIIKLLLKKSGMWNKPLDETRKNMSQIKTKGLPEGIKVIDERVNNVACKYIFHNKAIKDTVIIYFHGGGFCLGIYEANIGFVAEIAKRTGINAYMPDYRLAPENIYPAALEDAEMFYQGIINKGIAPNNIIIMGDSSGCALAVSTLFRLEWQGVAMPKAMAFITPVFDLAGKGDTFITRKHKDPFRIKDPLGLVKNYIGASDPHVPLLSPLYGELRALPPILIHAAEDDVFLSDSYRMEKQLKAYQNMVTLQVWKKMWHIFHMQYQLVPEANKALNELCSYVKELSAYKQVFDNCSHYQ